MSRASDRAYNLIRGMILSGELAPGCQLAEEALAELCEVSRTPIRDALRRLEADLLVRRTDTQRTFVADWSLGDVEDAFELRGMLEGHAAGLACLRMDAAALARLKQSNARILKAIGPVTLDIGEFVEANREFHAVILEQAASRRLSALLGTLIEQPVVRRTAQQYGAEQLHRSYREHEELIAAFERRDAAWARAVMHGHIRRAFHAYADAHKGLASEGEAGGLGALAQDCIQNSVDDGRRSGAAASPAAMVAQAGGE